MDFNNKKMQSRAGRWISIADITLPLFAGFCCVLAGCTVVTKKPSDEAAEERFVRPRDAKIVLVMLENKYADSALHQKDLPFLWKLAHEGAYLGRYYGLTHPSQPNYVGLVSGSIDGVRGDGTAHLERNHIGDRLDEKNLSWMTYAEGYEPGPHEMEPTYGRYARKHVPFLSFKKMQDSKEMRQKHMAKFEGSFKAAALAHRLPKFSLVIPNLDNDAHDKKLKTADDWLKAEFGPLLKDPVFRRDVILIVTFDEDGTPPPYLKNRDNNHIYAAIWGEHVIPGPVKMEVYDHYDMLRTMEAILGVNPIAAGDKSAKRIGGIWR
jgi:hypothetical protein